MIEQRKINISKEFIKNKVLNKELIEIQGELNSLKNEIFDFNKLILGSEGENENNNENNNSQEENIFGLNKVMNILFDEEGSLRNKFEYYIRKNINICSVIGLISDEGKKNLDLLFESLGKSKTEEELTNSLNIELNQLQNNIIQNNGGNNTGEGINENQPNIGGYENLSSIENKEKHQVSEQYIYKQAKLYGVTDNRQIAYILAIVKGECNFKNIKEIGGENRSYGKIDSNTGKAYYGRGFLQLTHKGNYEKYTKIIKESGLKFKDNNGNLITGDKLDLVKNPDTVLESDDLASFILIDWMKNGGPYRQNVKKLNHYINNNKTDFFNARYIINGDKNYVRNGKKVGDMYKEYAEDYLNKIGSGRNNDIEQNRNNILIEGSPELLATNRDQLGGIGSSIMNGIMNDFNKKNSFINMNGINSATTRNPQWFVKDGNELKYKGKNGEENMELGQYCKKHGIKSFMFYFGGNEAAISQQAVDTAFEDIKEWANYLQNKGIQPVLCTCVYEKIKKHSIGHKGEKFPLADSPNGEPGFNTKIRNLGKERGWPVIDFAKKEKDIPISQKDQLHPTSDGYLAMRDIIGIKSNNEKINYA